MAQASGKRIIRTWTSSLTTHQSLERRKDAKLDDGTNVWYCLLCGPQASLQWKPGIAESPNIDILTEMLGTQGNLAFQEGTFPSEMSEIALNDFIEQRLDAYQAARKINPR